LILFDDFLFALASTRLLLQYLVILAAAMFGIAESRSSHGMPKSSSYSFNSYGNSRSSASGSAATAAKSVYQQQPRIVQTTTAKSYTSSTPAPVPANQAGSVYYTTEATFYSTEAPVYYAEPIYYSTEQPESSYYYDAGSDFNSPFQQQQQQPYAPSVPPFYVQSFAPGEAQQQPPYYTATSDNSYYTTAPPDVYYGDAPSTPYYYVDAATYGIDSASDSASVAAPSPPEAYYNSQAAPQQQQPQYGADVVYGSDSLQYYTTIPPPDYYGAPTEGAGPYYP
jgi:hypothetical protein